MRMVHIANMQIYVVRVYTVKYMKSVASQTSRKKKQNAKYIDVHYLNTTCCWSKSKTDKRRMDRQRQRKNELYDVKL